MRLKVQNFMGCRQAELDLQPGANWLRGPNESGKSSVALALTALMTRDPNPLGLAPGWEGRSTYRHADAKSGPVLRLDGPDWSLRLDAESPVGMTVEADGDPGPQMAVGLQRPGLLDFDWPRLLKGAKAQAAWVDLLDARPDIEDVRTRLRDACADLANGDRVAESLVDMIATDDDWRGAQAIAEDRARKAKAEWKSVVARAGQSANWGSSKAADWRPPGWSDRCEGLGETEAAENLRTLRERLEQARAAAAVAESVSTSEPSDLAAEVVRLQEQERQAAEALSRADADVDEVRTLERGLRDRCAIARQEQERVRQEREQAERMREHLASLDARIEERTVRVGQLADVVDRERKREREAAAEAAAAASDGDGDRATLCCPSCGAHLRLEKPGVLRVAPRNPATTHQRSRADVASENLTAARRDLRDLEAQRKAHAAMIESAGADADAVPVSDDAIRKLAAETEDAARKLATLTRARDVAQQRLGGIRSELRSTQERLEKASAIPAADRTEDLDALQDACERAEADYASVRYRREAAEQHTLALTWVTVAAQLKPGGMRKRAVESALRDFNDTLTRLQCRAGWPDERRVRLMPDFTLRVDGIDLALCSHSEQWRALAAVALAAAWKHRLPALVIDNVDTLVGIERPGDTLAEFGPMIDLLGKAGDIAVLLCCAGFDADGDGDGVRMRGGESVQ